MRINALGNTATEFASDDYIAIDGTTNGSRKMKYEQLVQNVLAGNVEQAFDPSRTIANPYKAGEAVTYKGKSYIFILDHYGAWSTDDVEQFDVSDYARSTNNKTISFKSFKDIFVSGTITTSGAVGSVVNLTINASSYFKCAVVDCEEFDTFKFSGAGGSSPRLWCFIDAENKVIRHSAVDAYFNALTTIVAPPNSKKLIINSANSYFNSSEYFCEDSFSSKIKENSYKINKQEAFISFRNSFVVGNIYTNGAVGSVVDLTVNTESTSWRCAVVDCEYLDKFVIKGEGGANPRLWCFIDSEGKIISRSAASLNPADPITLVAPLSAKKIIVNVTSASYNSASSVFNKYCYVSDVLSIALNNKNEIDGIKEKLSDFAPLFNFTLEPQDFSTDIADMDFSSDGLKLMLEQVYTKFEGLLTDFPDLVTKYDAATIAGETYPAYANGVGPSDPDYLETPSYKTYMYKISNVNVGAGNSGKFIKKKMFIVAGQHGSEVAAQFNAYLFAKKLCDATEQAAFSILANFDVYIIPCLNGYGIYHELRTNANEVNINRNYPTPNWTERDSGTEDYTGPSAGSEFETKVVMGCVSDIEPDIFIDHHNYFNGKYQFYTSTCDDDCLKYVYNSLVNLSSHFIRLFPSYFGSFFRLLQLATSTDSPRNSNRGNGNSKYWAYSNGIPSFTIEICKRINYLNGSYSSLAGNYTNDAWKVAYMTLTEQLMRYSATCYN